MEILIKLLCSECSDCFGSIINGVKDVQHSIKTGHVGGHVEPAAHHKCLQSDGEKKSHVHYKQSNYATIWHPCTGRELSHGYRGAMWSKEVRAKRGALRGGLTEPSPLHVTHIPPSVLPGSRTEGGGKGKGAP